ncbi:MAG: sialidase family protein [Lysobacter sp.]
MRTLLAAAILVLLLPACERAPVAIPATAVNPVPAPPRTYVRQDWSLPIAAASAQPDLIVTADGRLLLSWIEPHGDGHALRFAVFTADAGGDGDAGSPGEVTAKGWSSPRTIASGTNWFVNWADTPHIAATDDGALWAHWLQKSAAATYAYDVALVRSGDGGRTWSKPVLVNDDGTAVEHGFVSLWPATRDAIGVSWLDGRNTAGDESHAGHDGRPPASPGPPRAMTLRAARFDANLQRSSESEIDAMTCDCCQTDVAATARGPLLVYRDRTAAEIRDIVVTRGQAGAWTSPRLVHADGWKMPACPVNGPAVAARGTAAVIAWYTAPGDVPMLRLAGSSDAGDTFSAPVTVDQGIEVQGRVDVALDAAAAWVLWVREEAGGQSLQLARYAPDLSGEPGRIEVAKIEGRGRATGFPQLALSGDVAYVVWTDVVDGKPLLRGATLRSE